MGAKGTNGGVAGVAVQITPTRNESKLPHKCETPHGCCQERKAFYFFLLCCFEGCVPPGILITVVHHLRYIHTK